MPAWASATEARDALRAFVSDGAQDRPVKGKLVIGPVDGANTTFFTWEERIVSDSIAFSLNGVEQVPGFVASQDLVMGRFVLASPPAGNAEIRARYYWQLFLDADLDEALRQAAGEIHETDEITSVEPGLKFAALHFGAAFAFTKQYTRWMIQRSSEKFLLVERPVEDGSRGLAETFKDAADRYNKLAVDLRLSYYERHGRRAAPAFTVYKPRIPTIGPRR